MGNRNKHRVLTALFNKEHAGEENTGHGKTVTPLGRSMTNIDLNTETGIIITDIDHACEVLIQDQCINMIDYNEADKLKRYLITPIGKSACIDRTYLNRVWFRQPAIIISILAFLIPSVISLWSLYVAQRNQDQQTVYEQRLQKLEKVAFPNKGH